MTNLNAQETAILRQRVAEEAFEQYDFGLAVSDSEGWDTSDSADLHRIVYGDQGGRYALHVRFEGEHTTPSEVYALDMATGNEVGHLPR